MSTISWIGAAIVVVVLGFVVGLVGPIPVIRWIVEQGFTLDTTLLAILTFVVWRKRWLGQSSLTLLSWPFTFFLTMAVAGWTDLLFTGLFAGIGMDPVTASWFGFIVGFVLWVALISSCLGYDEIPTAHASFLLWLGFPLRLELRMGKPFLLPEWLGFSLYRDKVGHFPEIERENTKDRSFVCPSPKGEEMKVRINFSPKIFDLYLSVNAKDEEELMLNCAERIIRGLIARDDAFGRDALEVSRDHGNISRVVESMVQEEVGNEIGQWLKLNILELQPPQSIMAAAAREAEETLEAKGLEVESSALADRALAFSGKTGVGTARATDRMLAADNKADLKITNVEGLGELIPVLDRFLEGLLDRFGKPARKQPKRGVDNS